MNREQSTVWSVGDPGDAFIRPSTSPSSPDFDSLARHLRRQISENFASPARGSSSSSSSSVSSVSSGQVLTTLPSLESSLSNATHELSESGSLYQLQESNSHHPSTPNATASPQEQVHIRARHLSRHMSSVSSPAFSSQSSPSSSSSSSSLSRHTSYLGTRHQVTTPRRPVHHTSSQIIRTRSLAGPRHAKQELNVFALVCQQLSRCLHKTRTLYSKPIRNAHELFVAMDTHETGYVSSKELLAATQRLDLGLQPQQVQAFCVYLGGEGRRISVHVLADAVVHHQ